MTASQILARYPEVIGALAIFSLCCWKSLSGAAKDKRWEYLLLASFFAIPANMLCQAITMALSKLRPMRLDYYLLNIDGVWGVQLSFAIGRFLEHHPAAGAVAFTAYNALPLPVLIVFMAHLFGQHESPMALIKTFSINLFAGLPIYLLVPVVGPAHAFSSFPDAVPTVSTVPAALPGIINGIPSVHFSTALFILWFSRHWRAGRILASVYLILIFASTLGSGEHYLFDLVAALPYSLAVYWVASKVTVRSHDYHHDRLSGSGRATDGESLALSCARPGSSGI